MKVYDISTGEQTWITPPRLQQSLGHFDLDPCAADNMPYRTADRMVTKDEDGLKVDWTGKRVWLNPPFGKKYCTPFLERMRCGIALLPARVDTEWFHNLIANRARAVFFPRGRIKYIRKDLSDAGSPAFASMLVAYTDYDVDAIKQSGIKGVMMIPYP